MDQMLIEEILKWLPVTSLLRFESISQLCRSTIRSTHFICSHVQLSPRIEKLLLVRKMRGQGFCAANYLENGNQEGNLELKFTGLHLHTFEDMPNPQLVQSSVHGLLCFKDPPRIGIYNPDTRKNFTFHLPLHTRQHTPRIDIAFGYDPQGQNYKILCSQIRRVGNRFIKEHNVSTLGEETWNMISSADNPRHDMIGQPICVSGSIYYLARHRSEYCIIKFNIREQRFDIIHVQRFQRLLARHHNHCRLMELNNRLSLIHFSTSIRIITTKGIDNGTWTIAHRLPLPKGLLGPRYLKGSGLHNNELFIAYNDSQTGQPCICFYNNYNTGEHRIIRILGLEGFGDGNTRLTTDMVFSNHIESVIPPQGLPLD